MLLFSYIAFVLLALAHVALGVEPNEGLSATSSQAFTDCLNHIIISDAYTESFNDYVVSRRRDLHRIPELMFEEYQTSAYLRKELESLGLDNIQSVAGTGLVVRIQIGSGEGPTVALRSDMDGLPITEPLEEGRRAPLPSIPASPTCTSDSGGASPRSENDGRMHACGHDAHMSMLLGALRLLLHFNLTQSASFLPSSCSSCPSSCVSTRVHGHVLAVFQPAEEGGGGAKVVVDSGILKDVRAVHGLHTWPALPAGVYSTRPHVIMAASDRFQFRIQGRGGHGAIPHLAADPVVAGAAFVMAAQTLVSRETSPLNGAVVTVARFNTGPGAANVIPDSVWIQGTLRALDQRTFRELKRRLEELAKDTVAAMGCRVEEWGWSRVPYGPTVNSPERTQSVVRVVDSLVKLASAAMAAPPSSDPPPLDSNATNAQGGKESAITFSWVPRILGSFPLATPAFSWLDEPSMAAEDFSFYGLQIPSVFSFLGSGDPNLGTDVGLHNPYFKAHDGVLSLGAAAHAAVALQWLMELK